MKKYKVLVAYNDTQLKRMTVVGEVLELDDKRAKQIMDYDNSLIKVVEAKQTRKPRTKKAEVKDGE